MTTDTKVIQMMQLPAGTNSDPVRMVDDDGFERYCSVVGVACMADGKLQTIIYDGAGKFILYDPVRCNGIRFLNHWMIKAEQPSISLDEAIEMKRQEMKQRKDKKGDNHE